MIYVKRLQVKRLENKAKKSTNLRFLKNTSFQDWRVREFLQTFDCSKICQTPTPNS